MNSTQKRSQRIATVDGSDIPFPRGCFETLYKCIRIASGVQEPTNRSEAEWPPFATSNSSGYLLVGEESFQLAREWSGLSVAFKDDCSRDLRPFPGSFEEFKELYGNNVKINGSASPGPALRA